jgi:hypothetical protein
MRALTITIATSIASATGCSHPRLPPPTDVCDNRDIAEMSSRPQTKRGRPSVLLAGVAGNLSRSKCPFCVHPII